MSNFNKTDDNRPASIGIVLSAIAVILLISVPAIAQDVFEEIIVVTATKRPTPLMDTPVAMSAIMGDGIVDAGITDMIDLQQNVVGLIVGQSQTATTTNFAIRGIGSTSNNFGVESSVGLYVDGVYRSRQSSLINDLIDVEAVEVLRGPQGTLFGKNTASGAISIRNVAPSQDRNSFVNVTIGDFGLTKVSAATNIPINDSMAFRGTIFSSQRDGYVKDIAFGDDVLNDRDRLGVRLQLAKNEPGDDFYMRIIADYAEIDETCCVAVNRVDSIWYRGSIAVGAPTNGSDAAAMSLGATAFTDYPYPDALLAPFGPFVMTGTGFDQYTTAVNYLPRSTNEDSGLSLDLNWLLDNGMSVRSISAFRSFKTTDFIDGDFSNLDVFTRTNEVDLSSFSQELQLLGDLGSSGNTFVAGLYYFGQTIDQETDTTGGPMFGPFVDLLNPALPGIVNGIEGIRAAIAGSPLDGLIAPATVAFPTGVTAFDVVKQDHSGWAAFGQLDFALSDQLTLTVGARYTDETKDIDATYVQTANGPQPDLRTCAPDPADPTGTSFIGGAVCVALSEMGAFLATGGAFGSLDGVLAGDLVPVTEPNIAWGAYLFDPLAPRPDVMDSLSDSQTTGTVKLTFRPNDTTMVYASYATGFKSGGTNTDRINPAFDQIFGPETSSSIELGIKGEVGRFQYVLTVFDTDFEDFQANSFSGGGFNLQNAGDVEVNGVEVELLWLPTDTTQVQFNYAHNEGKFKVFEAGTAWDTWVVHDGIWMGMGDPGCPGPVDPSNLPSSCSRTGDPIPYNPEDRAFVAVTQEFNLGGNISMFVRAEYTYFSEQFTDGDLDPYSLQDAVSLINLRVGFNFDSMNSTLTFWGRNITDERWYHGSFDVPVAEDKMFSYPSEPATYGVTFRKNFN